MSAIVGITNSRSSKINDYTDTAKAWCRFNGNVPSIAEDFNITSLDDQGTGQYKLNLSDQPRTGNFCAVACSSQSMELLGTTASASVTIEIRNGSNSSTDTDKVCVAIFV